MSKSKKGLTVDRDVGDLMRRPQEGYYYPEEHVNDKHSLHPTSRRQYGSSASLEVRHEQIRRQKEEEFFTSPSATRRPAPFENSRNTPVIQSNFHNADSSVYYQQPARQANNYKNSRSPKINTKEIPRSVPSSPSPSNTHGINTHNSRLSPNQNSYSPGFLTPQPHSPYNPRSPSSQHQIPPQNHYTNSASQRSVQRLVRENSSGSISSQETLTNPNYRDIEQYQTLKIPPGYRDQSQKTREAPIVDGNNTQRLNLPDPISIEDYISQAIKYHEDDQLKKSTEYLKIAAERGSPVGKVLYGIALRHGWGCKPNEALAFKHLQQAAESAITSINKTVSRSAFRGELVLAIYELGVCFRHGWGVLKSKATAAHYFEIAANMGDPDAQNDIALCYYKGEGVKRDMKMAAKYYRMADAQGHGTMGNSWIYKEKYNDDNK